MNKNKLTTLTLIALAGFTLTLSGARAQILRPATTAIQAPSQMTATAAATGSPIQVQMMAASNAQPLQVTLKWVAGAKWLAPLGYNVFRKGPGDADFVKIGSTVQPNTTMVVKAQTLAGKPVDVQALIKQAAATKPSNAQSVFGGSSTLPPSSRPAFDEMKAYYQKVFSPFTGKTRPNFDPPSADQMTSVKAYFSNFKAAPNAFRPKVAGAGLAPAAAADINKLKAATQPPTADQQALDARQALTLGSLVNNDVSSALGLRFVDTKVQTGQTYEYKLQINVPPNLTPDIKAQIADITGINPDNPGFVGGVTITVGADPQPQTPTGLAALQRDAKQVCLRWERDPAKTPAKILSYNIYRTVAGQRQKINQQPVIIGSTKVSSGQLIDPVVYYTDANVPIGPVNYELTGVDAFGRETQPIGLDFAMADWTTPDKVPMVQCDENNGQVTVYWAPCRQPQKAAAAPAQTAEQKAIADAVNKALACDQTAKYFVWRFDLEGSKVWTRLNDVPFDLRQFAAPSQAQLASVASAGKAREQVWNAIRQSYLDATTQKDNYYQYCVTAVYAKNNIESAPSNPEKIGVPDAAAPSAPGSLSSSFVSMVKQPTDLTIDARVAKTAVTPTSLAPKTRNLSIDPATVKATVALAGAAGSSITDVANGLQKATSTNSDLGGKVVVTWQPVAAKGPVTYKIYRANATGFSLASATQAAVPAQEKDIPGGAVTIAAATGSPATGVKIGAKSMLLKYNKMIDINTIKDSDYALIAQTSDPKFEDMLPMSRPMYYAYRVAAVSRWGVEGQSVRTQSHVQATLKPPTPQIISAMPSTDGGVYLSWQPLDDSQYVSKYLIYRKALQIDPNAMIQQTMPGLPPDQAQTVATALKTGGLRPESLPQNAAITTASLATLSQQFQAAVTAQSIKNDYQVVGEAAVVGSTLSPSGTMGYNDNKGLIPNSVYSYVIVAQDIDNWKSDSSSPIKATPFKCNALTVTNLQAALDSTGNGVVLTWAAGESGIRGYVVKRSVGDGSTYVQISPTLTATTYTDFGAMRGKEQTWQVFTVDQAGNLSKPGEIKFTLIKPKELMRPDIGGMSRPGGVVLK